MKTIQINRDSWHYKLATQWGSYYPDIESNDICTYLRKIAKALIGMAALSTLALLLGGGFLYMTGDFIAWLVFVLLHGWVEPDAAGGFLAMAGLAAVIGAGWGGYRGTKAAVQNSELVGAAWDSVHNKICARIQIGE